jgi:sterol desaturase/sphingolipid hydroxylase (fatty acid hydroxylase superfamily)
MNFRQHVEEQAMHRLMHHPGLFKTIHLLHHKSTNPSPWAAYAFYPTEAVIEAGIFIVLVMIMPVMKVHLFAFFIVMIAYNVYGHLGWELYPKGFSTSKVGRWINTSVNHNQHHQYFKGNYGLYFLWWDRWMKTIREDYETRFEEVKSRTAKEKQGSPPVEPALFASPGNKAEAKPASVWEAT